MYTVNPTATQGGSRNRSTSSSPARSTSRPRFTTNRPIRRAQDASNKQKVVTSEASLKIYPLGGQEEVGRNCTVFEYEGDIIILDMGLQF